MNSLGSNSLASRETVKSDALGILSVLDHNSIAGS